MAQAVTAALHVGRVASPLAAASAASAAATVLEDATRRGPRDPRGRRGLRAHAKREDEDRLGAELEIAEAHHAVRFGAATGNNHSQRARRMT
jgi:hypothetical protein